MRQLLPVLLVVVAVSVHAQSEWELAHDEAGLTIHTRTRPGELMREFRAVTRFESPLAEVIALFEDVSRFPEWYDRCVEARRLEGDGRGGVIYVRADLPFPVADRDVVFRSSRERSDPDLVSYRGEAAPDLIPKTDGVVRMPEMTSSWTFRRISEAVTEVRFQQRSNPGGAIPSWMANALVTSIPKNSLRELGRLVEAETAKSSREE